MLRMAVVVFHGGAGLNDGPTDRFFRDVRMVRAGRSGDLETRCDPTLFADPFLSKAFPDDHAL